MAASEGQQRRPAVAGVEVAARLERVARRMRRQVRLRQARRAGPQQRQDRALRALAEVERREPRLVESREPRSMLATDRVIRTPGLSERLHWMVPAPFRGWDDDDPTLRTITTKVQADLVVLAKFDLGVSAKLRAAYLGSQAAVAVQPVRPSGECGVTRAVRSHHIVDRHVPQLLPPLLGYGELRGDLRYLIEGWVEGRPLMSSKRLANALPELLDSLRSVQQGHGYGLVRLSRAWPGLDQRWAATREVGLVDEVTGRRIDELLVQDRHLRTSWVHGDLVASNIMLTDTGLVLIDLEHSMIGPTLHDAAKLHIFAARPQETLELVLQTLGKGHRGSDTYSARDELALVHAHLLSRYPARTKALEGHPRAEVYERQSQRQVGLLRDVLEL